MGTDSEMKEFRELLNDIKITVTRLDTRMSNFEKMETKLEKTGEVASIAHQQSMINKEDIAKLSASIKWAVGIGLTVISIVIGLIVKGGA
ncbi:hypothetical protein [Schinkia azotoformans]|uniref:hypothetical protein n=1 Tax=Schinkia azotoformans TaxID=1454 RepID=UPI002DBFD8AA|nr:hypothetical protein [Schinkia azotoformans]MEC1757357.1 hypothetical protein [Schinkia azotoformans]